MVMELGEGDGEDGDGDVQQQTDKKYHVFINTFKCSNVLIRRTIEMFLHL